MSAARGIIRGQRAIAVLEWMAGRDTGISSEHLAFASVGIIKPSHKWSSPRDEGDSGRCERLASQCPWVVDALPKLIKLDANWARWEHRIRAAAKDPTHAD